MNSFIVMQGETYHEEREAGILWTPQIDKSGMVPHSWRRMQELERGDLVFHYSRGYIVAVSLLREACRTGRVPGHPDAAFVAETAYRELEFPVLVKDHFKAIQPYLPVKYSAFQEDANGNSGYLYPCNEELAIRLLELISSLNVFMVEDEQLELAIEVVKRTKHNPLLTLIAEMELEIKTKMRLGREQFEKSLQPLWADECALCGFALEEALTTTYAKPWKDSTDAERLDPYNGILLCANHAALFKSGLIAFTGAGSLRVASRIPETDYAKYGLGKYAKVAVAPEHASYFRWHKRNIFVEPRKVKLAKPAEAGLFDAQEKEDRATSFIFDMDGTLFRTDLILERSLENTFDWLREQGQWTGRTPIDRYREIMGVPLPTVWETLLPEHTLDLREQVNAIFHERLIHNIQSGTGALYPNVEELFASLKAEGHSIYIASNGMAAYLSAIVEQYDLDRWVTETFSIEQIDSLDKGVLIGEIVKKYGITDGAVIGDRLSDIRAAKANGLTAVGCRFHFAQEAELAEADCVIEDLLDLQESLTSI